MPGEFDIIRRYFAPAAQAAPTVKLGLGDDCALVHAPGATELLAISTDTLVEGVHFLADIDPEDLAWRLLGSAVSDLAAMGAKPLWLTLAITLPDADESWLESFQKGLTASTEAYSITLVGGDTTSGNTRVLTAQVHGSVSSEQALTRSGAQPRDFIYVSGYLGDSRAGLELLSHSDKQTQDSAYLLQRFLRPSPRLALGRGLRGLATAAIDISDGLLADLTHILESSGLGADIDIQALPISHELQNFCGEAQARQWAATGGEDFELCFTVPSNKKTEVETLAATLGLNLSLIGKTRSGSGLNTLYAGDLWISETLSGFDHFGDK